MKISTIKRQIHDHQIVTKGFAFRNNTLEYIMTGSPSLCKELTQSSSFAQELRSISDFKKYAIALLSLNFSALLLDFVSKLY